MIGIGIILSLGLINHHHSRHYNSNNKRCMSPNGPQVHCERGKIHTWVRCALELEAPPMCHHHHETNFHSTPKNLACHG